jgi:hypothetical protein
MVGEMTWKMHERTGSIFPAYETGWMLEVEKRRISGKKGESKKTP